MNLDSNINLFLGLQAQLRILHWQTKGIARHQALGMTYDTLDDLIDSFVEQAMGKYGRFTLTDETSVIKLSNLKDLKPEDMANTVVEALNQFTQQYEETDTDLLNIRDEMLGAINKLKYLLTLE
jgi:DNA-binding ferritin-like protein